MLNIFKSKLGLCLTLQLLQMVTGCFDFQFECSNGKCISKKALCDTKLDCSDGSDETFENCYNNKCEENKCVYGACFSELMKCDGRKDCWDGTDEDPFECGNRTEQEKLQKSSGSNCGSKAFQDFECNSDKQCIKRSKVCNGVPDCSDGSDEIADICISSFCNEHYFRCKYGGCISRENFCNHRQDCADGSDEIQSICNTHNNLNLDANWPFSPMLQRTNQGSSDIPPDDSSDPSETAKFSAPTNIPKSCQVPSDDKALLITPMYNGLPFIEGYNVSHDTTVRFKCRVNHRLRGEDVNTCKNGKWKAAFPQCVKVCKIKENLRVKYICSKGGNIIDCKRDFLDVGTEIAKSCKQGYISKRNETQMTCDSSGEWRRSSTSDLYCKPDCGRKFPTVDGDPWLVSIYYYSFNTTFKFTCLAVIIHPSMVLTAAECFKRSHEVYRTLVILGKHTVDFDVMQEHGLEKAEIRKIELNVYTHLALLTLVKPLTLSARVRPICMPKSRYMLTDRGDTPSELGQPEVHIDSKLQTYFLTHISNGTSYISMNNYYTIITGDLKEYDISLN